MENAGNASLLPTTRVYVRVVPVVARDASLAWLSSATGRQLLPELAELVCGYAGASWFRPEVVRVNYAAEPSEPPKPYLTVRAEGANLILFGDMRRDVRLVALLPQFGKIDALESHPPSGRHFLHCVPSTRSCFTRRNGWPLFHVLEARLWARPYGASVWADMVEVSRPGEFRYGAHCFNADPDALRLPTSDGITRVELEAKASTTYHIQPESSIVREQIPFADTVDGRWALLYTGTAEARAANPRDRSSFTAGPAFAPRADESEEENLKNPTGLDGSVPIAHHDRLTAGDQGKGLVPQGRPLAQRRRFRRRGAPV